MIKLGFFLAAVIVVVAAAEPSSTGKSRVSPLDKAVFEAIFNNGYNQILAADLSPECHQIAITQLAEAKDATDLYKCDTVMDYTWDTAGIVWTGVNSFSKLVADFNTVINVIPVCTANLGFWDWFAKISCYVSNIGPIWNAIVDVFHYENFYTDTYDKIKEFQKCINDKNSNAKVKTQNIVKMAKLC